MELMQAIAAHIKLKKTLASYVAHPDHSLRVSVVGAIDRCELGKWLIVEGRRHSSSPEFSALEASHARFHRAAAELITRADSGRAEVQETTFDSTSEFAYASAAVVRSLMFLYEKMGAAL